MPDHTPHPSSTAPTPSDLAISERVDTPPARVSESEALSDLMPAPAGAGPITDAPAMPDGVAGIYEPGEAGSETAQFPIQQRGRAAVARVAHNHEVAGSSPAPAISRESGRYGADGFSDIGVSDAESDQAEIGLAASTYTNRPDSGNLITPGSSPADASRSAGGFFDFEQALAMVAIGLMTFLAFGWPWLVVLIGGAI